MPLNSEGVMDYGDSHQYCVKCRKEREYNRVVLAREAIEYECKRWVRDLPHPDAICRHAFVTDDWVMVIALGQPTQWIAREHLHSYADIAKEGAT